MLPHIKPFIMYKAGRDGLELNVQELQVFGGPEEGILADPGILPNNISSDLYPFWCSARCPVHL